MKKLLLLVASGLLMPIASAFLISIPAFAQTTQQDINNGLCSGASLDLSGNSSGCSSSGDSITKFNDLIHNGINLLSVIVGVVAVIMIIVGGLRYITSGGNDSSVTGAKNTILYAVVGLVIVALAQVLVHFVLAKVTTQ